MVNIWFASDHHFNHSNMLVFLGSDGKRIRPGFDSVQEMNETMILRHNEVVRPEDKVYFCGDLGVRWQPLVLRMNGKKRLIVGNHDDVKPDFFNVFKKIVSWRLFKEFGKAFVVSHYPLHPMSFIYRNVSRVDQTNRGAAPGAFNVHGHIHEKLVMREDAPNMVDTRFFNVAVEHLDYRPIEAQELVSKLGTPQKRLHT